MVGGFDYYVHGLVEESGEAPRQLEKDLGLMSASGTRYISAHCVYAYRYTYMYFGGCLLVSCGLDMHTGVNGLWCLAVSGYGFASSKLKYCIDGSCGSVTLAIGCYWLSVSVEGTIRIQRS